MPSVAPVPAPLAPLPAASSPALPWYVVVVATAIMCSTIGGPWDISWHMTIGRDTFWTPAHIAIYLGGATAGIVCGWLALRTTFFANETERQASVRLWGGRAPFGAWIAIWGAIGMLTAGPFDDWWHNAYGLDVKIISPPHVVLFLGGMGVRVGTWLLVLREQNRHGNRAAAWLFCLLGGLLLEELSMICTVQFWPNNEHSADYFLTTAATYPFLLVAIARASPLRWGTTIAAGTYMLFVCGLIWILPRFPAQPRLGPIYHVVTHLVPPPFPQWLLLPAIAIDLLKTRPGVARDWRGNLHFALAVAAIFLVVFLPTQWFFSRFYLSPAADNWFFAGSRIWRYNSPPANDPILTTFWGEQNGWAILSVMRAFAAATVAAFLGRGFGRWMSEVRR